MTFGRTWALALLAVPVLLLWLRLRAARPREAEASSLLVWQKVSPADTAPARPRPPLAAWLEALGAALLALGVADPMGHGTFSTQKTWIELDSSASMSAGNPDGRTRLESYEAIVSHEPGWEGAFGAVTYKVRDPAADVPHHEGVAKREEQDRRIVLVTDHRWSQFPDHPPSFRTVAFGAPCFNAGITAASGAPVGKDLLGEWRVFVRVEAAGASGPVQGSLSVGNVNREITVTPGRPLDLVETLRIPGGLDLDAAVKFANDALREDDAVVLHREGGAVVKAFPIGYPEHESLLRALRAAGADAHVPADPAEKDRDIRLMATRVRLRGQILLGRIRIPASADGPEVPGAGVAVANHPLVKDVCIDPASTLGRRGPKPAGGEVLLSDPEGPLLTVRMEESGRLIEFGFQPGGSWVTRDPSFVVLARNIYDDASLGPPRLEAEGLLDAEETRQAAEGETFGDLRQALAEAAAPDPATRTSFAFPLLASGAALLLAAWLAQR